VEHVVSSRPTSAVPGRRFRRLAVALAAFALLLGLTAAPAAARTDTTNKVTLFVHGYSLTGGTDCGGDFNSMISSLRSKGFTGPMVKLGFYTGDSNCDLSLRSWGSFSNGSSWKEIAKAFSKYVYSTYTSKGIPVDVVGYSMGGLITRGGVYGASNGQSGFSAPIDVEDMVTLGTPHNGAAWYTNICLWGQCSTMKPGATDIKWINQNGNPQGKYGTEFTAVGSNGDSVVSAASATYMSLPSSRKPIYSNVPHTGSRNYMHDATVVARAASALQYVNS
jgi:hypothetical protein